MGTENMDDCAADFDYVCQRTWESLEQTDNPRVRSCENCLRFVHLVETDEDMHTARVRGWCVAKPLPDSDRLLLGIIVPFVPGGTLLWDDVEDEA